MSGSDNPDEIDEANAIVADVMAKVRTLVPGIVVTYNSILGTAKVQIALRGAASDGKAYDQVIVPAARVMWMRFGGMCIMGSLRAGDEVALAVPHRSFDKWLLAGGIADPDDLETKFDYASAVVLMGLSSLKNPLPQTFPNKMVIGREDGSGTITITMAAPVKGAPALPATVTIEGAQIEIGIGALQQMVLGNLLKTYLDAHTHGPGSFSTVSGVVSGVSGAPASPLPSATLSLKSKVE